MTARTFCALAAGLAAWAGVVAQESPAVFQGDAAEQFLASARVTGMKDVGDGVTKPQKATLEANRVTRFAIFKTIDVSKPGIVAPELGGNAPDFQDSWRTEVAAYLVDRIIGLAMVPATVERTVNRKTGSMQWWAESMGTQAGLLQQQIKLTDDEAWQRQVLKMRLFDNLICNTDRNPSNILVTKQFELRLIDHSRAFRARSDLGNPKSLTRFSRALLDGLPRLELEDLRRRAGRYLSDAQITTLLQRRDAILALARALVAERGADAVLYP